MVNLNLLYKWGQPASPKMKKGPLVRKENKAL